MRTYAGQSMHTISVIHMVYLTGIIPTSRSKTFVVMEFPLYFCSTEAFSTQDCEEPAVAEAADSVVR